MVFCENICLTKLVAKSVLNKHQPSKRQFSKVPQSKSENLCLAVKPPPGRVKSVRAFSFQARERMPHKPRSTELDGAATLWFRKLLGEPLKSVCVFFIWEKPHAVAATTPSILVPLRLAPICREGPVPHQRDTLVIF